CMQGTYLPYSF
nr:immunoglobulin light chain junction region [Macaca mulatta]MOW62254.1 immunoglobulin light chain junction region [Macaca mulatta]MOW62587.1 immunoglobulin light chain junction region [Macaca mulatta]MOW62906.1 immunoglobulin light chain junction region [Macaca mulatta]MOW63738.1 immunoglobulin light chain junction region [Macaca mulatta]